MKDVAGKVGKGVKTAVEKGKEFYKSPTGQKLKKAATDFYKDNKNDINKFVKDNVLGGKK